MKIRAVFDQIFQVKQVIGKNQKNGNEVTVKFLPFFSDDSSKDPNVFHKMSKYTQKGKKYHFTTSDNNQSQSQNLSPTDSLVENVNSLILSDLLFLKYHDYVKNFYSQEDANNNLRISSKILLNWARTKKIDKLTEKFVIDFMIIYLVNRNLLNITMPPFMVVKEFFRYFGGNGTNSLDFGRVSHTENLDGEEENKNSNPNSKTNPYPSNKP